MTKIINIFGGPCAGKSTVAADLFSVMKRRHLSTELVTEYAKSLVYQGREKILQEEQLYIFAKQLLQQKSIYGQADFVVTDSPILLSAIYCKVDGFVPKNAFQHLVVETFNAYDNVNILLERNKKFPYDSKGRTQKDVKEAEEVDIKIKNFLIEYNIPFINLVSDEKAAKVICQYIMEKEQHERL
jgi:nicotinamide riboside kinase